MRKASVLTMLLLMATVSAFSQEAAAGNAGITLNFEQGFVTPLYHTLQFGTTGTKFDYVNEGSQNELFFFQRYVIEWKPAPRHIVMFLYQPLDLVTETALTRDIEVDGVAFSNGTAMKLRYGFSFYRASYLFRIVNGEKFTFDAGLSLQIRNASIIFEALDGSAITVNNNLGPVPILKFRTQYRFDSGYYLGVEADGFYATSSFFNGSDIQFEGAILDASIRAGRRLTHNSDIYLNIRYIGGGASGTDSNDEGLGDGYTDNWLSLLAVSAGFILNI